MEDKLLEIIASQATVINDLTQLVQTLNTSLSREVVINGFKKTSEASD